MTTNPTSVDDAQFGARTERVYAQCTHPPFLSERDGVVFHLDDDIFMFWKTDGARGLRALSAGGGWFEGLGWDNTGLSLEAVRAVRAAGIESSCGWCM